MLKTVLNGTGIDIVAPQACCVPGVKLIILMIFVRKNHNKILIKSALISRMNRYRG